MTKSASSDNNRNMNILFSETFLFVNLINIWEEQSKPSFYGLALIKHLLLLIIILWLLIVTFPSFAAWTNHYKWGTSENVSNFNKTSFNKDLDLDISTQEKQVIGRAS